MKRPVFLFQMSILTESSMIGERGKGSSKEIERVFKKKIRKAEEEPLQDYKEGIEA